MISSEQTLIVCIKDEGAGNLTDELVKLYMLNPPWLARVKNMLNRAKDFSFTRKEILVYMTNGNVTYDDIDACKSLFMYFNDIYNITSAYSISGCFISMDYNGNTDNVYSFNNGDSFFNIYINVEPRI